MLLAWLRTTFTGPCSRSRRRRSPACRCRPVARRDQGRYAHPAAVRRRASPGGRWPEDLRRQLADALATRLPRGDTLTTIAREHGVSLGALSKFARRNGHQKLATGRAAGRRAESAGPPPRK